MLGLFYVMVPEARLELARCYQRGILNPLCLPIPPLGQTLYINDSNRIINTLIYGGATRSRTEIDGFAIRSIAILPSRQISKLVESWSDISGSNR